MFASWCLVYLLLLFCLNITTNLIKADEASEQCILQEEGACIDTGAHRQNTKYEQFSNIVTKRIKKALEDYNPCNADPKCLCYIDVIANDLTPYMKDGISLDMIKNAEKYGTRYKILDNRLYRDDRIMFPARCTGIEHFILKLLPILPNMDIVINTRDWPQLNEAWGLKGPVFSFSKTADYIDIMYPAWTFWAGGPAISLHPTGIGRWDLQRGRLSNAAEEWPWSKKKSIGFFRGSRTSDERDALILLSRRKPELVDAQYTKNQAWKSEKDTLNAKPAMEVSFEDHCQFKYLFNFRGVAASFRFKHLFLCKSLVFHVGEDWDEFFYSKMTPWVHYVPLKSYPNEQELEEILLFFRNNDEMAKNIAERGYEFIWNHLRMQDIECYWRMLLESYAKLLKYKVESDDKLIEIKSISIDKVDL